MYTLDNFLEIKSKEKTSVNTKVLDNCSDIKPSILFLPVFFLSAIVIILYLNGSLYTEGYIQIQKEYFYAINSKLSTFPNIIFNLTQMGDTLIFLSLLSILIIYAPKVWESLMMTILVSPIFCVSLKNFFSIPRPAASFDNNSFVIIGEALTGHNSLPSGHSITIFSILTVILFGFMPQNKNQKVLWTAFIFITGLVLAFTRVGVGAHYPLDVIIGCTVGFISALIGILINQKYKIWRWIGNTKYHPIFIVIFSICFVVIANRIVMENLIIYYLSMISLVISIFKLSFQYAKK